MKYLLDTSTCIEFFNRRSERLIERLSRTPDSEIGVARKRPDRQRVEDLEDSLLRRYASIPFDDLAADHYAAIRAHLEAIGRPIGANDLMIAATARSRRLIVVTRNRAEFDRVPELLVEDWTAP